MLIKYRNDVIFYVHALTLRCRVFELEKHLNLRNLLIQVRILNVRRAPFLGLLSQTVFEVKTKNVDYLCRAVQGFKIFVYLFLEAFIFLIL